MADTSSDDFSDIEYAQDKNANESDPDSFGDFSESPSKKMQSQTKTNIDDDDEDNDFGSDQFEPDDDIDDDDLSSSKPEISPNINNNKMNNDNVTKARNNDTKNDNNNRMINNNKHNNNNDASSISHLYYNPRDYDSLNVNNEIKRLFEYIERFKYNEIELETTLKPFIPDYIPSIGNVDSFLKPTRSTANYDKEENEEKLGITYLDEPILHQSDPSTFHLRLMNESKQISSNKHTKVRYIVDAEKNPNKIRNWIDNFKKIKNKTNSVDMHNINNNLPEIEQLMQPFINEQFNKFIKDKQDNNQDIVPSYDINLSLQEYAKIICNVLDIPVINDQNLSSSLHLLFSTYAALQSTLNEPMK